MTSRARTKRPTLRGEATPAPGSTGTGRMVGGETSAPPRSLGFAVGDTLRGAFLDNAPLKFVALVLSLTVFILVHSDEVETGFKTVGISYPDLSDRVMVSKPVEKVRIEVKGSRRRIKRLHDAHLDPIHLDPTQIEGGLVTLRPDMLSNLPDGLEVISFDPASIGVRLEERKSKKVMVSVETIGSPTHGYRVESLTAEPAQVTISGAASRVAVVERIETAPVALEGRARSFRASVRLAPPEGLDLATDTTVQAQVTLGEEQGSLLVKLPVSIQAGRGLAQADTARFLVDPESVQVVLRGSILAIDQVRDKQLSAYVRLFPGDVTGARAKSAEVRIAPALPGIGYEVSPAEVDIRPREARPRDRPPE